MEFSNKLDCQSIAGLALKSFMTQSKSLQELLLQSKNEQTFSGLLSHALQDQYSENGSRTLLELKGKDYKKAKVKTKDMKSTRNFHDLSIIDSNAKFQVIIENKVWYHFDGAKGKKQKKIEKGVFEQIEGDIAKTRITLSNQFGGERGFLLIHLVTPHYIQEIPKSYLKSHESALSRTAGDLMLYRNDGLNGILAALKSFEDMLLDLKSVRNDAIIGGGEAALIDVICAEIKI